MTLRYNVKFALEDGRSLSQSEAYFVLTEGGAKRRLRFHDYDALFERPGLYEQIFYERLQCASPAKVAGNLRAVLAANAEATTRLRVLDLGAGNGIMGEVLREAGVSRIVGVDILEEARRAAERDRPGVYDDYVVADFCEMSSAMREDLASWSINCMTSVAALGFDDIPLRAFYEALNVVQNPGWVAFNIKETFLHESDVSGFSRFIREMIFSDYLDLHHLERYRHRLSMDGEPLYYFSLVARKKADIPLSLLERCEDA